MEKIKVLPNLIDDSLKDLDDSSATIALKWAILTHFIKQSTPEDERLEFIKQLNTQVKRLKGGINNG